MLLLLTLTSLVFICQAKDQFSILLVSEKYFSFCCTLWKPLSSSYTCRKFKFKFSLCLSKPFRLVENHNVINKHKLARKFLCRIRPRIRVYGETNDTGNKTFIGETIDLAQKLTGDHKDNKFF